MTAQSRSSLGKGLAACAAIMSAALLVDGALHVLLAQNPFGGPRPPAEPQVGGFIGWLLWLVVHITFLTGFKNRFGALARWGVSFVGRGRYERALTGRWVAGAGRRSGST